MILEACGSSSSSEHRAPAPRQRRRVAAAALRRRSSAPARATSSPWSTTSRPTPSSRRPRTARPTRASCSAARTVDRLATSNVGPRWSTRSTAPSAPASTASRSRSSTSRRSTRRSTRRCSSGIPVVAYNADAAGNGRLAYIGQDLMVSGQQMGEHIVSLLPNGGDVALFIATPGALNIQPRIDGALATLKSHPNIKTARGGHRRRGAAELTGDRLLPGRPPEHQGHVRRRRRQHPGRRPGDPEARPEGQGSRAAAMT